MPLIASNTTTIVHDTMPLIASNATALVHDAVAGLDAADLALLALALLLGAGSAYGIARGRLPSALDAVKHIISNHSPAPDHLAVFNRAHTVVLGIGGPAYCIANLRAALDDDPVLPYVVLVFALSMKSTGVVLFALTGGLLVLLGLNPGNEVRSGDTLDAQAASSLEAEKGHLPVA